ncbi:SAM-dependent methyltransferase [Corynebacterium yudongzhengii]|uniref:SAM-dependent methyltransferase n=1 Tax=Corynebacterium yudongzhengii TaxID=2080740 RepID=A0A2U1T8J3_9CORY|nr:class I SAM-dependent methyltransferase [Corynebacterium yudongzhengii]AWB81921.1 SAM-dependent methyltransferase [Corynebacterium yudongzhengii]PWC02313.1 SAM-dependent methyltransferase [Corynebacterium yudongzhengii]
MNGNHLDVIDDHAWPTIAHPDPAPLGRVGRRLAEAHFASAARKAELALVDGADLIIDHDDFFDRIASAGWTGFAESYMAGEWRSEDVTGVLYKLIGSGYRPRRTQKAKGETGVGELPPELVRLFSGDGMSAFPAIFTSAVSTSVRTSVKSHVPGAGRGREPGKHFVDIRTYDPARNLERDDLGSGQRQATEALLDAANVRAGTHVLEYPSAGGSAAIFAAKRRAAVDTLTGDVEMAAALKERFTLAGVADSVQTVVRDSVLSGVSDWRARYDAIVSVDKLEVITPKQRIAVLRAMDRMLQMGGKVAIQMTVATDEMTTAGRDATRVLGHYIWPGLDYPTVDDMHRLADRHTGLRIISQTHSGSHTIESLKFQALLFAGHTREAAAEGFDAVYRRLWAYQFALRRALFELGMLDTVQLVLTHRNRGGRR